MGAASVTKNCIVCGQEFLGRACLERVKTCSKKCGYESRKIRHREERKCERCGTAFVKTRYKPQRFCSVECKHQNNAEKRTEHKGWKVRETDGYVISSIRGRTVMQHRIVMEQNLGRELRPYENVHHLNGNRSDNRIENLELWVRRQPYGQRAADTIEWAVAYLRSHGYAVTAPVT